MQDPFQKSRILYMGKSESRTFRRTHFFRRPSLAVIAVIFLGLAVAGSVYALRLEKFRLEEVRILGVQSLSEDEIRETLYERVSGAALFFIPRDNLLIISVRALESYLKEKFPKIAEADVHKTLSTTLEVNIIERSIWGIGCVKTEVEEIKDGESHSPLQKSGGKGAAKTIGPCFYIDRSGLAFEDVSSFEGGLFPILYQDSGGVIGSRLFTEGEILFFEDVNKVLKSALELELLSVEFYNDNKEDARLTLKEGWSVIVTRAKAPELWLPVLRTLLAEEIKGRRNQLEYVDLRFGNKVFYKYR